MNILITICARGGSKGIPGKNIKLLNDIPLIAYTIKIAKQFAINKNCTIALSTDDLAIKKVASNYGLISDYKRPKKLAKDTTGKVETIEDVLFYYEKKCKSKFDYILDLDVTSPLRTLEDLENSAVVFGLNSYSMYISSQCEIVTHSYFKGKIGHWTNYFPKILNVDI